MNRTIKLLSLVFLLAAAFACDDESKEVSPEVSDEVSLLVATSVSSNTYGLNALIQQSVTLQQNAVSSSGGRSAYCDYTDSGEASASSEQGSPISFTYSYAYDVAVNCSAIEVPTGLSVDFTYEGSFDGPRLMWMHDGTGKFEITLDGDQNLVYNGTYDRTGSYDVKERENINGMSEVILTIEDITVNPETETIISGGGTYQINVVRSDTQYTLNGTINFNGDGTATVGINGSSVTFNLITGSIS
ncbi:MAG: hypothetical protein P8X57_14250 [Cyclobacteriaceae bacterium]